MRTPAFRLCEGGNDALGAVVAADLSAVTDALQSLSLTAPPGVTARGLNRYLPRMCARPQSVLRSPSFGTKPVCVRCRSD